MTRQKWSFSPKFKHEAVSLILGQATPTFRFMDGDASIPLLFNQ
ncbi:hypothetical protein [Alteromonas sp. ASW11-130]|nr:hypothetical protein [Alteromonas sp. ASW11-130]MCW8092513.1 hypothetical protein [Alteromonas sp. ASW11-130]